MTFRFGLLLFSVLASGVSAQPPSSPATSQGSVSTIHVSARIALVDATVIDRKGEPVVGLTAKDFAVYEDNKQQPIVSFEATGSHTLPTRTMNHPEALDPAKPATFGQSPVTMLVLDEINTHFSDTSFAVREVYRVPAVTAIGAEAASRFVCRKRLAICDDAHKTTRFNRDALIAALDQHKTVYAWKLEQSMSVGQGVAEQSWMLP